MSEALSTESVRLTWRQRRRCPHSNLRGIYGDEINARRSRLECRDCRRFIDGPVSLAESRRGECA